MTPLKKLIVLILSLGYLFSIALCVVGFIWGVGIVIQVLLTITAVVLVTVAVIAAKPASHAFKHYSNKNPGQIYEEESSKSGFCPYYELPSFFVRALILSEDARFFSHKGVCWLDMARAFAHNLFTSEKPVGGSTITQQLIKNVYLTPEVSIKRKITEMLLAVKIEKEFTKEKILELYANVIYYGHGQFGITNAAQFYYNCHPNQLSCDQCISLVAILPCPDKYNESANPHLFKAARQKVIKNLFTYAEVTAERFDEENFRLVSDRKISPDADSQSRASHTKMSTPCLKGKS